MNPNPDPEALEVPDDPPPPEPDFPDPGDVRCAIAKILLFDEIRTTLEFDETSFEIAYDHGAVRISRDADNYVIIGLVNQQVSYKATLLGGIALSEEKHGKTEHAGFFHLVWDDEFAPPEIHFTRPPVSIVRHYEKDRRIELGIEDVSSYRVIYRDGVEARFDRKAGNAFSFTFSTGFYGSFREREDGAYTLTFKGDRLKPGEDDWRSQSKFIVSRSKYTGNMLLILPDGADVILS